MLVHSSFRNTDRHIMVNFLYTITGVAYMFLHICFVISCMSYRLGFSTEWLNGNEFWNRSVPTDYSSYGMFCICIGFIWGCFGTHIALYVGYMALCHLCTALGKLIRFIGHHIRNLIYWADNTNVA